MGHSSSSPTLREAVVRRGAETLDTGTVAMLAAVLVWGPLDVAVTLAAWHLESNPLVLLLGPTGWIASKVLVIAAAVWVWYLARGWFEKDLLADAWMMSLATLGAVLVGFNVAALVADVVG